MEIGILIAFFALIVILAINILGSPNFLGGGIAFWYFVRISSRSSRSLSALGVGLKPLEDNFSWRVENISAMLCVNVSFEHLCKVVDYAKD